MDRQNPLLHNMSVAPKTVVKYSGLSEFARVGGPGGSGVAGIGYKGAGIFGIPVQFVLAPNLALMTPAQILSALGEKPKADSERQLAALINARAQELPLPEGCAVISGLKDSRRIWEDPLSALAILSKCSDSVWLRSKNPAIHAALKRQMVTLLVPPKFAALIPELNS